MGIADLFRIYDVSIVRDGQPPLAGQMSGRELSRLMADWSRKVERGFYRIRIDNEPTRSAFLLDEILSIIGVPHEQSNGDSK